MRALSVVCRAKFLDGLRHAHDANRLTFAGGTAPLTDPATWYRFLDTLHAQAWVVYAKPPFGGPERVLAYLARYTHRVAITNSRLVDFVDGVVRFRWKDYADHDRVKVMAPAGDEFLRRFLLHVLPRRFVRIRHAGLFGNHGRHARLDRCRTLLGVSPIAPPATEPSPPPTAPDRDRCPVCQQGTMHVTAVLPPVAHVGLAPRTPDPP